MGFGQDEIGKKRENFAADRYTLAMKRYRLTSLGCKVNQYDGAALGELLRRRGYVLAETGEAEVVLVNTCSITAVAMKKSRQQLRKMVRENPAAGIAVVGCYSTYHADAVVEALAQAGADPSRILVAGHHEDLAAAMETFVDQLESDQAETATVPSGDVETIRRRRLDALEAGAVGAEHLPPIAKFAGHQRAFVKVQDGCDAFCSYCVVPYTRSRVWSKSVTEVVAECGQLVQAGHREIVLCGVFLGAFGRETAIRAKWNLAETPLAELVRRVGAIDGLWRVRLSSLEPADATDELMDAMRKTPTFAPHLHLPLQSGSGEILRAMNRQYTPDEFLAATARLHAAFDRPALSTDIIVGFPGETDAHFAETMAVAKQSGFMKIHAFPFSAIEPTPAWQKRAQCPPGDVVRARLAQLAELEAEMAGAYRQQFVGESVEALVEWVSSAKQEETKGERFFAPTTETETKQTARAMTDRYVTVEFPATTETKKGDLVRVDISTVTDDGLSGTLMR